MTHPYLIAWGDRDGNNFLYIWGKPHESNRANGKSGRNWTSLPGMARPTLGQFRPVLTTLAE